MSVPWTVGLASKVLKAMTPERLAQVTYRDFQIWPCKFLPKRIGEELISNERASRRTRKVEHGQPTLL